MRVYRGHCFKTRAVGNSFYPYVYIGAPHWWRVNRGITYASRVWAERQAMWAIDDYVEHGITKSLSILPERRK